MRISCATICLDEEEAIGKYLKCVTPLFDEIVIVDGGSTDKTVEIINDWAKSYKNIKLLQRPMPPSFSDQYNLAFRSSSGDWVVRIDADEVISKCTDPDVFKKIAEATADRIGISFDYYYVSDQTFLWADKGPWHKVRMIRNRSGVYYYREVHEMLNIESGKELISRVKFPVIFDWGHAKSKEGKQKRWKHMERFSQKSAEYGVMISEAFYLSEFKKGISIPEEIIPDLKYLGF